jgi:hypothetical protein
MLVERPRIEYRLYDRNVAGAAADIPRQYVTDSLFVGIGLFGKQGMHRRQNSRRAKTTLQGVMFFE